MVYLKQPPPLSTTVSPGWGFLLQRVQEVLKMSGPWVLHLTGGLEISPQSETPWRSGREEEEGADRERRQERNTPGEKLVKRYTRRGSGVALLPRKEEDKKCKLTLLFVNARTQSPLTEGSVRPRSRHIERKREKERITSATKLLLLNSLGQFQLGHKDVCIFRIKSLIGWWIWKNKLLWQNVINVKGKMMRVI